MCYNSLKNLVSKWTGQPMDGLGFPLYPYPGFVNSMNKSGVMVPKFSQTMFHSLTDRQLKGLSMGYFIVLKRDPDLKVYVGDGSGRIWEIIILKDDLPALRVDLEELGLKQMDFCLI